MSASLVESVEQHLGPLRDFRKCN